MIEKTKTFFSEQPVLITGSAGFIGFHLARKLLKANNRVIGIDNFDPYYDIRLKKSRNEILSQYPDFTFIEMDLYDHEKLNEIFAEYKFANVVHLAAQAGVRYSLENPRAYVNSNLVGFFNVLDLCKVYNIKHFIYASSSSVYGLNTKIPFSVQNNVDHPISLYAASKKSNELQAHCYSHLYRLPTTGLRFFTVYGPWGRPDMAYFKFCKAIRMGKSIDLYNNGIMQRDFTYIDDIIQGVIGVLNNVPEPDEKWSGDEPNPSSSPAPFRVYNIGRGQKIELKYFLELIEKYMGKTTNINLLPMQPGDVYTTFSDVSDLVRDTGYSPEVSVEEGLKNFVDWFEGYYKDGNDIP